MIKIKSNSGSIRAPFIGNLIRDHTFKMQERWWDVEEMRYHADMISVYVSLLEEEDGSI